MKSYFKFFLCLSLLLALLLPVKGRCQDAAEISEFKRLSAQEIFNRLEQKTEQINTLRADMVLTKENLEQRVVFYVKSPNMFSAQFYDKTVSFHFNGTDLWLYMQVLNEAFYYSTSQDSLLFNYLSFFSPKKLLASLTKSSLFALFDIKALPCSDKDRYCLRFEPIAKGFFKKAFAVGYYKIYFSSSLYLPVEVVEFSPERKEVGRLKILSYEVNKKIDSEKFNFKLPKNTKVVEIKEVIKQKLFQAAEAAAEKAARVYNELKERLFNWSF